MDNKFLIIGQLRGIENYLNKLQELSRDIQGFAQWGVKVEGCLPLTEHLDKQLREIVEHIEQGLYDCCIEEGS